LRADIAHGLDSDVLSVDSSGQPKKWIQPLHVIDQRPLLHGKESLPGYYVESKALKSLRDQWQAAINYADHAQFITWNDYSETAISPSLGHGYGILDISSYYLTKFKTGSFPVIKRDAVYLIHRNQLSNSTYKCSSYIAPKIPCTLLMQKNNTSVSDFENVEAMVFLTSPATLEITVGSAVYTHNLGSGLTVVNSPLGVGKVKAKLVRNSQTLESVTSPYIVTNNPEVQDMQYHIFSSLRD
jgi:hypothetical protein